MALCLAPAHRRPSPNPYLDPAWHIVAAILRLGRPAHPCELAKECDNALKFPVSADIIEFLCRIEGSPLSHTGYGFVTLSHSALKAVAEFAMQLKVTILPPAAGGGLGMTRIWVGSEVGRFFNRKRQGSVLLPMAKRRTPLLRYHQEESKPKDDEKIGAWLKQVQWDQDAKGVVSINTAEFVSRNNFFYDILQLKSITNDPNDNENLGVLLLDLNPRVTMDKLDDLKKNTAVIRTPISDHVGCSFNEQGALLDSNAESERAIPENGLKQPLDNKLKNGFKNLTTASCAPERLDKDNGSKFCSTTSNTIRRKSVKLEQVTSTEDQETTNDAKPAHRDCFRDKYDDSCVKLETCQRKDEEEATAGSCYRRTSSRLLLDADSSTMPHASATLDHIPSRMGMATAPPTSTTAQKHLCRDEAAYAPDSVGVEDSGSLCNKQENTVLRQDQFLVNKKTNSKKLKLKQNDHTKDIAVDTDTKVNKFPESKRLPLFDSFIVEEEEGSGGYGTVYRAKRKNDGKIFAIKCPHVNARSSHVQNESKMLERFGGRNFVIKFEGSFKSGSSECFILEHVAHDRPELLKKDIDLIELQWYGYCMFKALASLHKQGVVHRDVKPGNFLFSRVLNKGYLIDFNLATDLHHKHRTSSIVDLHAKEGLFKSPIRKPELPTLPRKPMISFKEPSGNGQKGQNRILNKHMKKSTIKDGFGGFSDKETRHKQTNKGADGSGLSSVRDVTSTRTPSVERSKEPLPSRGRKELLNLVQEVLRSPNQKVLPPPVSQRKRVAAPLGRADRISALLTPMPLHCSGVPISGGEQVKNKGGKHKNEGPCVGTKGFRAPEVLFRSPYQSCKVDTWSAGVTILYMILGRTPFAGEPEQNIKEIARLRGSEDLWEVAKLHNRESSFPSELYDIQFLTSTELRQWCEKNTKRPDFLRKMPNSLFDLVDKCLTVNPRSRISAEEALMHDFFLPCRESLRRQRSLRQTRDLELESQV